MELTRFTRIKWERALDLRKRGLYQEAEDELREALNEQPDSPLLRASLAELYLRQDRILEARVLAEEILVVNARHPQALYVLGEVHFRQKNFDEALNCFRQGAREDERPYLALRVIRTLRELGRHDEALGILDSSLLKRKDDPYLLKEKALVLNRMGRHSEALSVYEDLRRAGLKDGFVRKEIVRLKGVLNEQEVTVEELEKVVSLPSGGKEAQFHGLLGTKLKQEGRLMEAARAFRAAATLEPENLYFLKQEGFCLYRLGEYTRALDCLVPAFRKDPTDYYVKVTLNKIYTTIGKLKEFVDLLEEMVHDHPDNYKLLGTLKGLKKRFREEEAGDSGT